MRQKKCNHLPGLNASIVVVNYTPFIKKLSIPFVLHQVIFLENLFLFEDTVIIAFK